MSSNVAGLLAVLVIVAAAGCKEDHGHPADVREYHGDPSSVVCGQRWSHDVEGFYCNGPTMNLDELAPFRHVVSIRMSDLRLEGAPSVQLDRVFSLVLNRAQVEAEQIVDSFPQLRDLMLDETELNLDALRRLTRLENLNLGKVRPPSVEQLAALPQLRVLSLGYLRCDQVNCERAIEIGLHSLRPEIEITVNGRGMP